VVRLCLVSAKVACTFGAFLPFGQKVETRNGSRGENRFKTEKRLKNG
jgi:hypothetical protein